MAGIADLGHRIREARVAQKLTQAQLAKSAAISRTTLSQLENGVVSDLGVRKVDAILEHLGLSLSIEARRSVRPDYLKMAATVASVSFATPLTERELRQVLVTGKTPRGKVAHVRTLLEEAPTSLIRGLIRQVGSTNKPGRIEAHVKRIANALKIPASRVEEWMTNG